ncbi:MauE/DoxX family redox-associated membrane protein [Ornithinimicrobium cryptoxanthini]|uniref:MauE/DoxX family redox-associated membrane protein n=1 Tax=Ornithinimicrobium cryptoxanthini TaxID=2934161 RepID=UPI002118EE99|nr:MauE/DoxX family redox-associated membrane protein [Ornithinimicrobium cryptoxanthini]
MSILSPALLGAVGLVLLAAAVGHLRDPGSLRRGLRAHGVLPDGTHRFVSVVLGPLEAVLGAAALVAAVTEPSRAAALAVSMPIAGLFLALTGYLAQVLRVTAGQVVPCACGLGDTPVGGPAVLRGGILTAMAFAGGATATGWSASGAPVEEVVVALAAALVLGLATALLPAARAVPDAALRASATAGSAHHGGHR